MKEIRDGVIKLRKLLRAKEQAKIIKLEDFQLSYQIIKEVKTPPPKSEADKYRAGERDDYTRSIKTMCVLRLLSC